MVVKCYNHSYMIQYKMNFLDAVKLASGFAVVFVGLQLVTILSDVILVFCTALILAIAMDKPISRLETKKVPRLASALVLYISVFAVILLMLYIIIPQLVGEVRNFTTEYSNYSESLPALNEVQRFDITPYLYEFSESLKTSSGAVLSAVFKTIGSFTTFLAIFFVALFLNLQRGGLRGFMYPFVPLTYKNGFAKFFDNMQDRIGNWLWGKTISSLIVGLLTYIGLSIIGIPYALTLGVLAVFFNFIPFIGPVIVAVPAVFLALTTMGVSTAVAVVLLYFFVNSLLEAFVLTPLLMKRAIEINPAFIILSVMSGAYLGGVLGIIIAIPVSAILYLALTEYIQHRSRVHAGLDASVEEGA